MASHKSCILLLGLVVLAGAVNTASARSLLHGDSHKDMLMGKLQQAKDFVHKHMNVPKSYATQTVLAAQPTVVVAPMPVLAPQPQTLVAPTRQEPPPPSPPAKTKSITLAGHHKSITITKSTPIKTPAADAMPAAQPVVAAAPQFLVQAQPAMVAAQPTVVAAQPTMVAAQPAFIAPQPTFVAARPATTFVAAAPQQFVAAQSAGTWGHKGHPFLG